MEKLETKGRREIVSLFDAGTFVEMGAYIRRRGEADVYDAVLCGYGAIEGKLTFAFVQDSDRKAGALDEIGAAKIEKLYEQAVRNGAPVIGVFDSAGAVVYDGATALSAYGRVMKCVSDASGIIPQIAYVSGVCGGMAAVIASMFDFTVTAEGESALYVNAPNVVGGKADAATARVSGLSAITAADGASAVAAVRELAALLPSHNRDVADVETADAPDRAVTVEGLSGLDLIRGVSDYARAVALYEGYGDEIVTAFALMGGRLCGVIATDAKANDGQITTAAARKAARLVSFCDSFSIPVVTLVDSTGVACTNDPEQATAFAKLANAYATASCAKISVVTGKAYGAAFTLLGSRALGADLALALPTAVISVMSPERAVAFAWNDKITHTEPRAEVEAKWLETYATPTAAAECGDVDDIVPAEELRARLCAALYMLSEKADLYPDRKHGVLPL
jgi:acetyl-CoA carboxylase carboxyltransferase component